MMTLLHVQVQVEITQCLEPLNSARFPMSKCNRVKVAYNATERPFVAECISTRF